MFVKSGAIRTGQGSHKQVIECTGCGGEPNGAFIEAKHVRKFERKGKDYGTWRVSVVQLTHTENCITAGQSPVSFGVMAANPKAREAAAALQSSRNRGESLAQHLQSIFGGNKPSTWNAHKLLRQVKREGESTEMGGCKRQKKATSTCVSSS